MRTLFEILYISDLAANQTPTVIRNILPAARTNNLRFDITGLLIFDGQHFLQLIEGDEASVKRLMERIEQDTRHGNVIRLHESARDTRRFSRFSMGYSYAEGADAIAPIGSLRGTEAMDAFLRALPSFDLDG